MLTSDDLRFFHAIAASRSLAAAARVLNVSPPAVTQRLRALETRLKVQLIHRGRRFLTLTDEGELLGRQGRDIISSLSIDGHAPVNQQGRSRDETRLVGPGAGPLARFPRVQRCA